MSDIRRDLSSINNEDDNQYYHRKRTKSNDYCTSQQTDAKVYVGNVPTDNLTDSELLDFFKSFGKVLDIRVYKGYIFVQYDRVDDAKKLIKQGQISLTLKGNKLDVLPAMEASLINTKSSLNEVFSKNYQNSQQESSRNSRRHSNNDHHHSSNYEPPRKRYQSNHHQRHQSNFNNNYRDCNTIETNDEYGKNKSSSRNCSHHLSRSPNTDLSSRNHQPYYTVLKGPDNSRQLVDCQIILVNPRQRSYGEEISSYLACHGLVTSIILLREDYSLTEAIENAAHEQCLYGIIAMPMHEERHTASFHILYGETEEHRNLTLEDGYHIILTNFDNYKERIRNNELNKSNKSIIYSDINQSKEDNINSLNRSILSIGDKLPLSMLLCLLADGRQLTLDEIDRILVYLLEKKAKMLTLPQGTLPPLPAQYATNQIGSSMLNDSTQIDSSSIKNYSSSEFFEQIRQILSTNLIKSSSNSTIENLNLDDLITKNSFQNKNNLISEQQKISYPKSNSNSNSIAVVTPSFHYPLSSSSSSSSTTTTTTTTTALNESSNNYSSYDPINQSLTNNSPLKQTNLSQSCEYFFPSTVSNQNIYQTLPNSSAADAAAAIFQAYSQFNARPTSRNSIINQQTNTQQQIRK